MTPPRQALSDYLRTRRALGFKLRSDQRRLESFVDFLEQAGAERITTDLALKWARMPVHAHPHTWSQRRAPLRPVRGDARPFERDPSEDLLPAHRTAVDLADGVLHVRARQHKQREVPLHPTATRALRDYARLRDRRWPASSSLAFFLNLRGQRLRKAQAARVHLQLLCGQQLD